MFFTNNYDDGNLVEFEFKIFKILNYRKKISFILKFQKNFFLCYIIMADISVTQAKQQVQAGKGYPQFVHWVAKHKKGSRGSATKMVSRLWKLAHAKKRSSRKRRSSRKGARKH